MTVEKLLPLPHHAEESVIDEEHLEWLLKLDPGRQRLHGHLETAIATDTVDELVRLAELRSQRRRDPVAHGAQAG